MLSDSADSQFRYGVPITHISLFMLRLTSHAKPPRNSRIVVWRLNEAPGQPVLLQDLLLAIGTKAGLSKAGKIISNV